MGLLGRLFRGGADKREETRKDEALGEYSGMRFEVLSEDEELLFIGSLQVSAGGRGQLYQRSALSGLLKPEEAEEEDAEADASPDGEPLPDEDAAAPESQETPDGPEDAEEKTEMEPLPVKLRGYDERQKKAIHMAAILSHVEGRNWQVDNLRITGKDNDRASFRQPVRAGGKAFLAGRVGGAGSMAADCQIHNISVGGVCIQTTERYELDQTLMLRFALLPGEEMPPLMCRVLRVTERKDGIIEYGCKFLDLNQVAEDDIAASIMEIQRQEMQR